MRKRVRPAIHRRVPTSRVLHVSVCKTAYLSLLPLTVELVQDLPFGLSLMKEIESGSVVEEEKQYNGYNDHNRVNVVSPSPAKVGVLVNRASFRVSISIIHGV
jgi:hypothetical protein